MHYGDGPVLGNHLEKGWIPRDVYMTFNMHLTHAVNSITVMDANWCVEDAARGDYDDLSSSALEDWESDMAKMELYWDTIDLGAHRCSLNAKDSVKGKMINFHIFSESVFTVADQVKPVRALIEWV